MRVLSQACALLVALGLSAPSARAADAPRSPRATLAREVLRELIAIDTTLKVGSAKAAQAMAARLRAAGFAEQDVIVAGPDPVHLNVVARLRGKAKGGKPILLMAHLDVVDARREDWSFDPFTLVEKDGWLYGRGTTDMKDEVADAVANFVQLKKEGFVPGRDLILALTDDEEGGDFNGVVWLLEKHRDWIDAAYAINLEGGGGAILEGHKALLKIQTSDKAYVSYVLEARHSGGHSSLPGKENAIYRLAKGLTRLADDRFPVKLNETTRAFFERAAALETGERAKDMRSLAGATTDLAAAERIASWSVPLNALMRTTCVPTLLEGGHAENALPQSAKATVNCRVVPDETPEQVEEHLKAALADPAISITRLTKNPISSHSALSKEIDDAVAAVGRKMWPGVVIAPIMSTGTTDARYLRRAGIPAFGVNGLFEDINDVRAHGKDERVGARELDDAVEFLDRFLRIVAVP